MLYMPQYLKLCNHCGKLLPASKRHFYFRRDNNCLSSICISCNSARSKSGYQKNREQIKARTNAYYHENREQILIKNRGNEKKKAYMQTWHEANKDHEAEYDKRYKQEHRTEILARKKAHRERTKEHRREYEKHYRANNRDSVLKRMKDWRDRNAEHRKNYKATHRQQNATHRRNRYARMKAAGGQHTVADIQRQHKAQKGKCYWCGVPLGEKYHVDHVIPIAKGGTNDPSNLVIACPQCNQSKNDKFPWEWEGNNGKLF